MKLYAYGEVKKIIGVFIEDHFDMTEYCLFNMRLPAAGYNRRICATSGVEIGIICHSLWLYSADPTLIKGEKVTYAQNIICDLDNAGSYYQYGAEGTIGKELSMET